MASVANPTETTSIRVVAPGDVHAAFARAAAQDGIQLASHSFDWLSEQGHVGLERVAKARREATLVRPVTAALGPLGVIYARLKGDLSVLHAARENLLLPVDLMHEPELAYHDALRDLATPAMGYPPLVRIAAVDRDGAAAYRRHRARLMGLLGP